MATQVFADEELERLRGFPEIGREKLFQFFTSAPADVVFVDPGRGRGPADRLGLSVALCTLPAAVLSQLLGLSISRPTHWTAQAGNTRPGYAATVARRTELRTGRQPEAAKPSGSEL